MKMFFKKKSKENTQEAAEMQYKKARWSPKSKIQLNGGILLLFAGIMILISVCVSFFVASRIYSAKLKEHTANKVVFDLETTDSFKVGKFQDIIDFIESDFGLEYDMDILLEGAIKGMIDALDDPYSFYIEPGEYKSYEASVSGVYQGIGIEYKETELGYEITKVLKDTQAFRAGFQVGDTITHIDGMEIEVLSDEEISQKFSAVDTQVAITLQSPDGVSRTETITVVRILQTSVFYKTLENDTWYIRIEKFDDDTGKEFSYALDAAKKAAAKGLIIDLRGNRGGYEREASKVADAILGEGLIAYAEDRNGKRITEIVSDKNAVDIPIVMLADGGSASASELVLGAFRDFERGVIVGTKTYGKALGQLSRSYSNDGSGIVLTVSRYFTPSGECIHGIGISPDVAVELGEDYAGKLPEDIPAEADTQLAQALVEMGKLLEES